MFITADQLIAERERLSFLANRLEKIIESSPEGSLYYRRSSSGKTDTYISINKDGHRIRKPINDTALIEQLKRKKVARFLLGYIRKNLKAVSGAGMFCDFSIADVNDNLGKEFTDCAKELLTIGNPPSSNFTSLKERQNPSHPENMNVITELGKFRSKTEALIAYVLTMLGIVFKYEAPLFINGEIYYPDFTILHPKTGEIIYLEHFGLLSKKFYRDNMCERIAAFAEAGIFAGQRLLITTESGDGGIDILGIKTMLSAYFL